MKISRPLSVFGIIFAAVASPARGQTTYTWDGGASGNGTAFSTAANWAGDVRPGSATAGNNDIAEFTAEGTGSPIGLNFGNLGTPYYFGTLRVSAASAARTFGSSAGVAGTLVLGGTGANNLVIDNQGANVMTVNALAGGTGAMTLNLATAGSTVNAVGNIALGAAVTGTGGIVKTGAGTLTLSNTNTYTGKTTVSGGALVIGNEANIGANPGAFTADQLTLAGGTLQSSAPLTFAANRGVTLGAGGGTFNTAGGNITVSNVLSGSGGYTKTGANALILLNGANTANGPVTVSAGTVQLGDGFSLPGAFNHTTVAVAAGATFRNRWAESTFNVGTAFSGAGTVEFNGTVSNVTLSGNNSSFTGTFAVSNGATLQQGSGNAVAGPAAVALGESAGNTAGKFKLNGFNANVTALTAVGTGTNRTVGGSATLSTLLIQPSAGTVTYTGILGGPLANENHLGVSKSGLGTFVLTAANTYTGGTILSGGTLLANTPGPDSATGTGTVGVDGGTLGGTGRIGGSVVFSGSGTLAPGVAGPGSLALGTNLLFNATSSFAVELNGTAAGTQYDRATVAGNVNAASATLLVTLGFTPATGDAFLILDKTSAGALAGTFRDVNGTAVPNGGSGVFGGLLADLSYTGGDGNDLVLSNFRPVPEPATVLGVAAGALVLARRPRRR